MLNSSTCAYDRDLCIDSAWCQPQVLSRKKSWSSIGGNEKAMLSWESRFGSVSPCEDINFIFGLYGVDIYSGLTRVGDEHKLMYVITSDYRPTWLDGVVSGMLLVLYSSGMDSRVFGCANIHPVYIDVTPREVKHLSFPSSVTSIWYRRYIRVLLETTVGKHILLVQDDASFVLSVSICVLTVSGGPTLHLPVGPYSV